MENVQLATCEYRGAPTRFNHSAAYGQAGPVMVELMVQHDDSPSALRDVYASNEFGIHHQASFTDDLRKELQRYADMGYPTVMYGATNSGIEFAMVDTRAGMGTMLELYLPTKPRRISTAWSGMRH